jgi:phosphoglycolate phosphatase-like HAD superfamily hydrolase
LHLLFDVDGTLVDPWRRAYSLYAEYGRLAGVDVFDMAEYVRSKRQGWDERAIARGTFAPDRVEPYLRWKLDRIEAEDALGLDSLVEGMKELLEELGRTSTPGVLSARQSRPALVDQLARLAIGERFRSVVCIGPGSGAAGKAAAVDAYRRRAGIETDEVILIGDTEVEIEAARLAGVRCISVAWGLRDPDVLELRGAETVVRAVPELARALEISSSDALGRASDEHRQP